jgi:hypothetical protein
MDFLQRIDWHNHDGVNLGMINDFMRNQFFDRVLSQHVRDRHCTDVGFGTGLLSMLALKHGAKHVRAFESDPDRYQLGCYVIERLALQNQITLINERYNNTFEPTAVTFTETVNGNLWWEGLWNSLPVHNETLFLPGQYFLEIWAAEIPRSFAQGLCDHSTTAGMFAPGVDISADFVNTINGLRQITPNELPQLPTGLVGFERQQETAWGWIPYMRAVSAGQPVASYSVGHWSAGIEQFDITVDTSLWTNSTVLVVPRMGLQHGTDRLYLDTGHWGPGENPVLLVSPQTSLVVSHSVTNGIITYSMEP